MASGRVIRPLRILLFVVVVAVVFGVFVPQIADLSRVGSSIASMDASEYLLLAALALLNIITYVPVWMAGMPGLTFARAFLVDQTGSTVAMTVPGGGALAVGVTYSMYASWGFTRRQIAAAAFGTGLATILVKLLLPIGALAIVAAEGNANDALRLGAVTGAALIVVGSAIVYATLRSDRLAGRMGSAAARLATMVRRPFGRPAVTWDEAARRFRSELAALVRGRGPAMVAASAVSQLSTYLVLIAALRFAGVSAGAVTWAEALAVFALVRLASAVPIVPGNLGLADLGYIAALIVAGGGDDATVAAVLVFRFLTYFVQVPLGVVTYALWRRGLGRQRPPLADEQDHTPGHAVEVEGGGGREGREGLLGEGTDGDERHPAVASSE